MRFGGIILAVGKFIFVALLSPRTTVPPIDQFLPRHKFTFSTLPSCIFFRISEEEKISKVFFNLICSKTTKFLIFNFLTNIISINSSGIREAMV